jgi:hypothetical protein
MKPALLLLLSCGALAAQTCAITSPTSAQIVQTQQLALTATVSSAPTAVKIGWLINSKRLFGHEGFKTPSANPFSTLINQWAGSSFAVFDYPAYRGDGPVTVSATMYDILGNAVGSSPCATVSFTVRNMGASQTSFNAIPTTCGPAALQFSTFDSNGNDGNIYVDGANNSNPFSPTVLDVNQPLGAGSTSWAGGRVYPNFDPCRFPNGPHEFYGLVKGSDYVNAHGSNDPYVYAPTFTSGGVSGNNITLTHHFLAGSRPICATTTGTLPAPLTVGSCWFWTTSASWSGGTITAASVGSGLISITTSAANGTISGVTQVQIRNFPAADTHTGLGLCDGLYTVVTGGNPFTVTAPAACPAATYSPSSGGFEVYVNPLFANVVDNDTITVSATPGGAPITLTNGGSGTHTFTYRLAQRYFSDGSGQVSILQAQVLGAATQIVTLANGNAPMELHAPAWEYHGWPGKTGDSVCPKVWNTDLTTTTLACNASGLTYTVVPDGLNTGVVTVNASGTITYTATTGWAKIQVACAACAAGAVTLPTRTYYVQNQAGTNTSFPTWTTCGAIAANYQTGSCPSKTFFSMWNLMTVSNNNAFQSIANLMKRGNINTSVDGGLSSRFADASTVSCAAVTGGQTTHDNIVAGINGPNKLYAEYGADFQLGDGSNVSQGPSLFGALLTNTGFNRATCIQSEENALFTLGGVYRVFAHDELNAYIGGSTPAHTFNLGTTDLSTITWTGGVATVNSAININGTWSQSSGLGAAIHITGASTNSCLNGWQLITGITAGTSFTFNTPCAGSGTATSGSDAALALNYMYMNNGCSPGAACDQRCVLPPYVGNGSPPGLTYGKFGTGPTTATASGSLLTVTWPSHGFTDGVGMRIQSASNAAMNTVGAIHVIDANTFSIPNGVAAATYTSGNEAGAIFTMDCGLPNNGFGTLRSMYQGATHPIAQIYPILAATYTTGGGAVSSTVTNWLAPGAMSSGTLNYNAGGQGSFYGTDGSVLGAGMAGYVSGLFSRAWQTQPRSTLAGAGYAFAKQHQGFQFNPATDIMQTLYDRPETYEASLMVPVTWGQYSPRVYNFQTTSNVNQDYTRNFGGENSINPNVGPQLWSAQAHSFGALTMLDKFLLGAPCNSPDFGPWFSTTCHTNMIAAGESADVGNVIMSTCLTEAPGGYGSFTVDLTSINISGGSEFQVTVGGYATKVVALAGNPTSVSYNGCSTYGPGETVYWAAQPPGQNDLDSITFAMPSPLPLGATAAYIRVGYYPDAMEDDPVTLCTSGCAIPINHANVDAWYQVLYTDSNGQAKGSNYPDAIKIASQN